MRRTIGRLVAGAMLVALLAGLGCNSGPNLVRVTGTLRYKNEPVPGFTVHFVPDEGRLSWGFTDQEGRYELEYDARHKGALAGSHKVYLICKPEDAQRLGLKLHPATNLLLQKYGNLATTPLRFEVTEDNPVIDIDLN
jgi:hypothetical protein